MSIIAALLLPSAVAQFQFNFCPDPPTLFREADGTCNHNDNFLDGSFGEVQPRLDLPGKISIPPIFRDVKGVPDEAHRKSPREISNAVSSQDGVLPGNLKNASVALIFFGQFLDHDITLIFENPRDEFNIEVPEGDEFFKEEIEFLRSDFVRSEHGFRDFVNRNTAWLDLSNVYGDTFDRQLSLRALKGGLMLTNNVPPVERMPFNRDLAVPVATAGTSADVYACGDIRCNENIALLAYHTLFVREHNRIAREIAAANPEFDDERLFQEARTLNVMQYQRIIFTEYLPVLLGTQNMMDPSFNPPYDPTRSIEEIEAVDPSTDLMFSTCSYRYGHSGIPEFIRIARNSGLAFEEVSLADSFFVPEKLEEERNQVGRIFNGIRAVPHEALDVHVVDALRNALFANVFSRLDLVSLNIQRGRDHGVPGLTAFRACDTHTTDCFKDLTGEEELSEVLRELYEDDYHAIDCWIGGMAEKKTFGDSQLGETFSKSIMNQFLRYRDADRLWYNRLVFLDPAKYSDFMTGSHTLGDIIKRNTAQSRTNNPPTFLVKNFFASAVNSTSISFEWTGRRKDHLEVDVTGFELKLRIGEVRNEFLGPAERFFTFTGLQPNTEYRGRLIVLHVVDGETKRNRAEDVFVTTPPTPPSTELYEVSYR